MGYRSDVLSAVVFADASHNTKSMVAWKLHCAAENKADPLAKDKDSGMGEHITFPVLGGKWPCILLKGEGWKWYEGYEDVKAWTYFTEWMDEQHDAVTVFIRIGEETEDVVETYSESTREDMQGFYACDFFGVTREIRCDV